MDSINKNQPEHNHENLSGEKAIEKLKELGEGICFFVTRYSTGDSDGARPMAVQEVDEEGNLWFFSAADSHKNLEIDRDPQVELFFQNAKSADFLHVKGRATVSRDRKRIEELWSPLVKTWFTEGIDDPRVTLIKVEPTGGYYWDTKHGPLVAGIKILLGAATGRTFDDSIEGQIDVR